MNYSYKYSISYNNPLQLLSDLYKLASLAGLAKIESES